MTKNHRWVTNHDKTVAGKSIRKNSLKKLRKKAPYLTTTEELFSIVGSKKPLQVEIKPSSISKKQILKLYGQARKYHVNVQWSSFHPSVLQKIYRTIQKKYGTAAANRLKLAFITGKCVAASSLRAMHAGTVDLRYYRYGGGDNLNCGLSLSKQIVAGKRVAVAYWTLTTSKTQYINAWKYGATAVLSDWPRSAELAFQGLGLTKSRAYLR